MLYLIAGALAAYALYQLFADNRDDRPPSRPRSRTSPPPPVRRRDERPQRRNTHPSQREYPPVEAYASLRARAKQEGDLMAHCYRQSQEAYERRDRARAKALSDEGKRHALKMEDLNTKASAIIFKGKLVPMIFSTNWLKGALRKQPSKMLLNRDATLLHGFQDKAAGEVDLHGLYVKEAIAYSEKALAEARRRGDSQIRLIVGMCISPVRFQVLWPLAGQGTHSDGGISRLKPAIQEAMRM